MFYGWEGNHRSGVALSTDLVVYLATGSMAEVREMITPPIPPGAWSPLPVAHFIQTSFKDLLLSVAYPAS